MLAPACPLTRRCEFAEFLPVVLYFIHGGALHILEHAYAAFDMNLLICLKNFPGAFLRLDTTLLERLIAYKHQRSDGYLPRETGGKECGAFHVDGLDLFQDESLAEFLIELPESIVGGMNDSGVAPQLSFFDFRSHETLYGER